MFKKLDVMPSLVTEMEWFSTEVCFLLPCTSSCRYSSERADDLAAPSGMFEDFLPDKGETDTRPACLA
jgi:hypothetical protein